MIYSFYGDSHTLGAETDDHLILGKSFEEVNSEKKELLEQLGLDNAITQYHAKLYSTVSEQYNNIFEFIHRPNKLSYPYVFGNLCNVDVVQNGLVATSQAYIEILIKEHHRLGLIDPSSHHLVVGLCRPTRSYSINNEGNYNIKFQLASANFNADELKIALKRFNFTDEVLLSTYLTDNKLVLDYFTAIDNTVNFANTHGYKLTFVKHFTEDNIRVDREGQNPGTYKASCNIDPNWEMFDYCVDIWQRCEEYMLEDHMHTLVDDDDCCGFYHPPAQTHEDFAKYIAQKIFV